MTLDGFDALRTARIEFVATLEAMDLPNKLHAVEKAVIETGGTWITRRTGSNWGPHDYELSLYGVTQSGDGVDEVIRRWIATVIRIETAFQEDQNQAGGVAA